MQRFSLQLGGRPEDSLVTLDGVKLTRVRQLNLAASRDSTTVTLSIFTPPGEAAVTVQGVLLNEDQVEDVHRLLDFLESRYWETLAPGKDADPALAQAYADLQQLARATRVIISPEVVA